GQRERAPQGDGVERSVEQAVRTRVTVAHRRGEAELRRLGVRLVRPPRALLPLLDERDEEPPGSGTVDTAPPGDEALARGEP
ncbi:MAG: hypothetical protein JRI55_31140, partial [Deltaproteobacteria bacterium]|nr:hypothetical protein [Deltaproteobacteria bacterium]